MCVWHAHMCVCVRERERHKRKERRALLTHKNYSSAKKLPLAQLDSGFLVSLKETFFIRNGIAFWKIIDHRTIL